MAAVGGLPGSPGAEGGRAVAVRVPGQAPAQPEEREGVTQDGGESQQG